MGRCGKRINILLIISMFLFSFSLQGYCEELQEQDFGESENIIDIPNDFISEQIIDVEKDISEVSSDVQENKEILKEVYNMQKSEQEEKTDNQEIIDYTSYFQLLHEDMQKIMISIWCLFGMLLGTKLIRGMFGNG